MDREGHERHTKGAKGPHPDNPFRGLRGLRGPEARPPFEAEFDRAESTWPVEVLPPRAQHSEKIGRRIDGDARVSVVCQVSRDNRI